MGGTNRAEIRRMLADLLLALALFWAVAFHVCAYDTLAHAVPLPALHAETTSPDVAWHATYKSNAPKPGQVLHSAVPAGPEYGLLLLSLAVAAITAFNLAFLRHLRRVYASPRRSGWRRG